MDRHEPQVQTNSINSDSEANAARRILNSAGNFLNDKFVPRAVAILAAGALTIGLAGCGANANAEGPKPSTSTSAEADPSASPTETEGTGEYSLENTNQTVEHDPIVTPENKQELLESLQIDSTLSPEEKATKVMDLITRWNMAGATPEIIEMDQKNAAEGIDPQGEDLAKLVAEQNAEVFAVAAYGENWKENFSEVVQNVIDNNAANIYRYMVTFGSDKYPNANSINNEAFTESYSDNTQLVGWADPTGESHPSLQPFVGQAQEAFGTEDVTILTITANRSNNAENNSFQENPAYAEVDGEPQYLHIVLASENGHDVMRYGKTENHDFGNIVNY